MCFIAAGPTPIDATIQGLVAVNGHGNHPFTQAIFFELLSDDEVFRIFHGDTPLPARQDLPLNAVARIQNGISLEAFPICAAWRVGPIQRLAHKDHEMARKVGRLALLPRVLPVFAKQLLCENGV